jgi:hypothetical protein
MLAVDPQTDQLLARSRQLQAALQRAMGAQQAGAARRQ